MKILVDFIVLLCLYLFLFFPKWKTRGKGAVLVNTLMYVYLTFVLYFTLMPIVTSLPFIFNHPYVPMNLMPFHDLIEGKGDFLRQVVLNVVMTIPFGFLLPLTKQKKCGFVKTVLYTFGLSLCIEFLQPLLSGFRSADITDIITNTVGGMIGYACLERGNYAKHYRDN